MDKDFLNTFEIQNIEDVDIRHRYGQVSSKINLNFRKAPGMDSITTEEVHMGTGLKSIHVFDMAERISMQWKLEMLLSHDSDSQNNCKLECTNQEHQPGLLCLNSRVSCIIMQWLFMCRFSGQVAIYFPPRIMQQLLLLSVVCLCMHGKVRRMRSTSGVLNRFVTLL